MAFVVLGVGFPRGAVLQGKQVVGLLQNVILKVRLQLQEKRNDAFQPVVRRTAEHFAGAIPQSGFVHIVLRTDQFDQPIVHFPMPEFQPGHIAAENENVLCEFGLRQPQCLANFANSLMN